MDDFLLIGRIVAPFGVTGQVKFKAETDRPEHIVRHIKTVYLGDSHTPYQIARIFEHKPGLLVAALRTVTSRDAADELRGVEIYIRAVDAAPLAADEYFVHDLIGLSVFTVAGESIGTVRDVLRTGASDILRVKRSGKPEALIPMVADFVETLDIPGKRVVIRPIEGLL